MVEGEVAIIAEEGMPTYLVILLFLLKRQIVKQRTMDMTVDREIGFLALHGFLHLLGYDHMNEEDEAKMFGRQKEILASFGLER